MKVLFVRMDSDDYVIEANRWVDGNWVPTEPDDYWDAPCDLTLQGGQWTDTLAESGFVIENPPDGMTPPSIEFVREAIAAFAAYIGEDLSDKDVAFVVIEDDTANY